MRRYEIFGAPVFKSKGDFRANPVVADGKIYIGNKYGESFILKEGRELEVLHQTTFPAKVSGACPVANGTSAIRFMPFSKTDALVICRER